MPVSAVANDAFGNLVTAFAGEVRVSSSDEALSSSDSTTFAQGRLSGLEVTFGTAGEQTLTLTSSDDEQLSGSAILVVSAFAPPMVALLAPAAGALTEGEVTIAAEATVAEGSSLRRLAILVDGVELASGTELQLETAWAATPGTYTLTAEVEDAEGARVTSSPVAVTVLVRKAEPPAETPDEGCGCGGGASAQGLVLFGMLALVLRRRTVG